MAAAHHRQYTMPSGVTKRRLGHTERRQQLIDCGVVVAARMCLRRFTHAEVAKEAGVSVPTVFKYFASRRELVDAVLDSTKTFYLDIARHWNRPEILGHTAIRGMLGAFADSLDDYPHYAYVWLEWSISINDEMGMWESFLDYQKQILAMIGGSVLRAKQQGHAHPAVSASVSSKLILASAYTIIQLRFTHKDRRVVNQFMNQMLHLALHDLPHEKDA